MSIEKIKECCSFLKKYHLVIWLCSAAFIMYVFLLVYRYTHLAYSDWDTAFYVQSLWNLLHGRAYSSLFEYHCFGGHAEFINLLVLPLFALFKHPLLFSFIEVFLFVISAGLLYLMIEEDLAPIPALLITFTYLIFPANFFGMCHEISSESLTPFFFLLAIFFFRKKELVKFYVSLLFLVLIKENLPLVVMMFGLWGMTRRDRDSFKWGVIPVIFAIVYFIVIVKWVIPYFHGSTQHSLWGRFSTVGTTPKEILFNLFTLSTLEKIFLSPININYILALFGVLLIPAFLSPAVLLLVGPIVFYHLISTHLPEKTIYYYYGLTITPAIFLASVQTLKKCKTSYVFQLMITLILLLGTLFHLYSLKPVWVNKIGLDSDPEVMDQWRLIQQIPSDAPVIATFKFLPALSLRSDLHSFHKIYDKAYQDRTIMKLSDFNTNKIFNIPDNVEYALIDFNDRWLKAYLKNDPVYLKSKLEFFFNDWVPVETSGSATLFKKRKNLK